MPDGHVLDLLTKFAIIVSWMGAQAYQQIRRIDGRTCLALDILDFCILMLLKTLYCCDGVCL